MPNSDRLKKSRKVDSSLSPVDPEEMQDSTGSDLLFIRPIAESILSRLPTDTGQYHKKRLTLLAVAQSRAAGVPIRWNRPEIASMQTWYAKWQHDPLLAKLLQALIDAISKALEEHRMAPLEQAATILRVSSVQSAATLAELLAHGDPDTRRLAAVAILDRAGKMTAPKQGDQDINFPGIDQALATVYGNSQTQEEDDHAPQSKELPAGTQSDEDTASDSDSD